MTWLPVVIAICAISFIPTSACAHFLQTDPVGYKADVDLYTYVVDDPTDRTDPSGDVDDVTGGSWSDQAELNTPEAKQGAMGAVSATTTAVGTYFAPERVAVGGVVGAGVSAAVSASKGNSSAQVLQDAKTGAVNGATTSAGGALGGKVGKAGSVGGEFAGAYASAKATGASDTDAGISATFAAGVGAIFQYVPGLSSEADPAAVATGGLVNTVLRSTAKGTTKAVGKMLVQPGQSSPPKACTQAANKSC